MTKIVCSKTVLFWGCVCLLLFAVVVVPLHAQEKPKDEKQKNEPVAEPLKKKSGKNTTDQKKTGKEIVKGKKILPAELCQFITLKSPVDDSVFGQVKNSALKLQNLAMQSNSKAVLVLEIRPGTSPFHQVHGLARFLTSANISEVNVIAWLPETVTGNNVILALAANEIVIHPDAEIGDIGRGEALSQDEQEMVFRLIDKRHNIKLSHSLILVMMNPKSVLLKITIQVGKKNNLSNDTKIVTSEELKRLQESGMVILNVQTIKEAGVRGIFSGKGARALDILVSQTLLSRNDIVNAYNLPMESMKEDPTFGGKAIVKRIRVDDMIEPVLEEFIYRQINRAIKANCNVIIFEIDSPGGFVISSKNIANAIADLSEVKIRTIAYVPSQAISGAAIVAFGCDEIYLHPTAKIGDAGPIEIREGNMFHRADEKILSELRGYMAELAERKNRPPALLMAMADRNLKVYHVSHRETGRTWFMTEEEIHESNGDWIKGRLVPESDKNLLLTVNGIGAHDLKLAEPPVQDFQELKLRIGIPPDEAVPVEARTWLDTMVFLLNTPMAFAFLLVLGICSLYVEAHLPSGLFGILSAVCFGIIFWSRFLGGTAGWLEVVLFLIGLACIGIEIFVIPGFGVFGISGILLMIASILMASQTWNAIDSSQNYVQLSKNLTALFGSLFTVIVLAILMNYFLPRIPFLNRMILVPEGYADDPGAEPRLKPELMNSPQSIHSVSEFGQLLGLQGKAISVLRPAGKVRLNDHLYDVTSNGPFIKEGQTIEVIQVEGNNIVVREIS